MNIKKSFWKIATVIVAGLLILNPEALALGVFVDAMGLDVLLLALEVQVAAVFGCFFHSRVKPVLMPVYRFFQKIDPYFFIPTKNVIGQYPSILCHAAPGFMALSLASLFASSDSTIT